MTWTEEQEKELIQIFERYQSLGGCLDMKLLHDLSLFYSKYGTPKVEELTEFFSKHMKPVEVAKGIMRCSFCGKRRDMVTHMIASFTNSFTSAKSETSPHICDECVALCNQLMSQADKSRPTNE